MELGCFEYLIYCTMNYLKYINTFMSNISKSARYTRERGDIISILIYCNTVYSVFGIRKGTLTHS